MLTSQNGKLRRGGCRALCSPYALPLATSRLDRHSDKRKFCNGLNKRKSCELSEYELSAQRIFEDFQAEYEGSIPITRSNYFQ